jgi:hypothetical protein
LHCFFCRRLKQEDRSGADFLRAVELKAVELSHKAEIIERKERRELAALLARYKQKLGTKNPRKLFRKDDIRKRLRNSILHIMELKL